MTVGFDGPELVLKLSGIGRTFPGTPPVEALIDASFAVTVGEYVAVTGRSGSGKSTLMNLLGLLDAPSVGSHEFDGMETARMAEGMRTRLRGERIGYVFQSFNLLSYQSAARNVELGLLYANHGKENRRALARTWLERVGLSHRVDARPATLSGGEQQRVAIARALAKRPALLLCDEPTGSLDSQSAGEVMRLLDELNDEGQTIILVTHDPATASRARRTLQVADGVVRP